MNTIPEDIYEQVHELAAAIVNASGAGDETLRVALCDRLRIYYDEMAASGRFHPFLTETTADYTDDGAESARLYELALVQARAVPGEPTHTKMISLARVLIESGRKELAEAYLRDGRTEAARLDDTYWIEEADRLLREIKT